MNYITKLKDRLRWIWEPGNSETLASSTFAGFNGESKFPLIGTNMTLDENPQKVRVAIEKEVITKYHLTMVDESGEAVTGFSAAYDSFEGATQGAVNAIKDYNYFSELVPA